MSDPLATYTFLPWLRQGIASKIREQDTLGSGSGPTERASVHVSLQVNSIANFVAGDVEMIGPGDVIGISPRAVVRTEPRNWITDFEPNYLAFIEFYDEDFPWRYTPARALEATSPGNPVNDPQQTRLRPWLFLLVLAESEFERIPPGSGPLPVVRLRDSTDPASALPPPDQTWAWAHVHVSQDITAGNTLSVEQTVNALEELVRRNPDEALSRLVSPRKLRTGTAYHAFLVPTFEIGRLAGLGLPTTGQDALAPSWGAGQKEFPVYYQWYFRTGKRGDFEYLVRLLKARSVQNIGVRDMDMQQPEFGVSGMIDRPGDEPVMGLEGALKSPDVQPRPQTWPPPNPADRPIFLNELADKVNLQDTLLNTPDPDSAHPDPVISPPLYGRWHALQQRLNVGAPGWVNELNQDPRYRVPAGFGTQVIQRNQESYIQRAWQQMGDILRANQKIRQVQLSIAASQLLFTKILLPLNPEQQIAVTQQVHRRVLGSPTTISQQVNASKLPQAALKPAFRRLTRPRGVLTRKTVPKSRGRPTPVISQLNQGLITAAPPKAAPEKQIALDKAAHGIIPAWIPGWLRRALLSENLRLLLLWMLFLLAVLFFLIGPGLILILLAVLVATSLGVMAWLRNRARGARRLSESNLTTQAVDAIPPRSGFEITQPGASLPPGISQRGDTDSPEAANFRTALRDLHARFEAPLPRLVEKLPLDLTAVSEKLVQAVKPTQAIPRRVLSFIAIPKTFKYLRPVESIVPVMAHPVFRDPMYKPLRDISSELLIPNNTITLLVTNPKFIAAYIVGLNHEMGREMLWRGLPTDQRPSSFLQFWDVGDAVNRDPEKDPPTIEKERRDWRPLHTWGRSTPLGTHENRDLPTGGESGEPRLVLVIRGDLLKKYPTAVIYAQKARWVDDPDDPSPTPRKIRVLDERDPGQNILEPVFKAEIEPDIKFLGFNLTASQAKGDPTPPSGDDPGDPGIFFNIAQRPGETRFGADEEDATPPIPKTWNELAWNHLGDPSTIPYIDLNTTPTTNITASPDKDIRWGANAADMAYILYQAPVMVAVHADEMLI